MGCARRVAGPLLERATHSRHAPDPRRRAGAFSALATAHHARCLADPELNHPFSHGDQHPQHVERLAAYWAEVMGGPEAYSSACAALGVGAAGALA
jgi:hypothetical protein